MKQDYKGFTVPSKIWYSEQLTVKAKFVACCIIDFKTIESGIRIAGSGSVIRIFDIDIEFIVKKQSISQNFFFAGIAELEDFGFISNYNASNYNAHETDYIEFQINF